ncbi:MAG: hypothetical protein ACQESK_09265 [Bacteroidota bacterium]
MENSEITTNHQPIKTGEWFVTLLITAIPLVGLIMLFVWAFGSNTNPSKANWAKAALIWMAIMIVIYIIIGLIFGTAVMTGMQ